MEREKLTFDAAILYLKRRRGNCTCKISMWCLWMLFLLSLVASIESSSPKNANQYLQCPSSFHLNKTSVLTCIIDTDLVNSSQCQTQPQALNFTYRPSQHEQETTLCSVAPYPPVSCGIDQVEIHACGCTENNATTGMATYQYSLNVSKDLRGGWLACTVCVDLEGSTSDSCRNITFIDPNQVVDATTSNIKNTTTATTTKQKKVTDTKDKAIAQDEDITFHVDYKETMIASLILIFLGVCIAVACYYCELRHAQHPVMQMKKMEYIKREKFKMKIRFSQSEQKKKRQRIFEEIAREQAHLGETLNPWRIEAVGANVDEEDEEDFDGEADGVVETVV